MTTEKFCTKCGRKFIATGREVICPACKEQAAEDAKRAAVLKAKRASWNGESVPVRISGRASTVIREYGAEKSLSFAAAIDELLKASSFFQNMGKAWEDVEPYRSHRRDKATAQEVKQDGKEQAQDVQAAGKPQEVKAAKVANKTSTTGKKGEKVKAC